MKTTKSLLRIYLKYKVKLFQVKKKEKVEIENSSFPVNLAFTLVYI